VAKRSVKKTRQQQGAAPAEPVRDAGEKAPSLRGFWLGVIVAAIVLVPVGAIAVVIASGDEAQDPAAAEQAAVRNEIESEAETLRRQTQVRDKQQVKELTDRMRATVDDLGPVLGGLARTLPPGEEKIGPLAQPGQVRQWRATVRKADEFFAETVSGETGTNVARGGFASSLDALIEATGTYALALERADLRERLLERARNQRDLAVRTWSVAATQLDAINIATGYGHQHVYLGGPQVGGAFGADPAPEGSGADG
jgi:hypothetical protein